MALADDIRHDSIRQLQKQIAELQKENSKLRTALTNMGADDNNKFWITIKSTFIKDGFCYEGSIDTMRLCDNVKIFKDKSKIGDCKGYHIARLRVEDKQ
jgi:ribosomal protein L29